MYILNFNKYSLLEKKDFRKKIKKFLDIPEIVEYAHQLSPKFSVWIANCFKVLIEEELGKNYSETDALKLFRNIKRNVERKILSILDWLKSPLNDEKVKISKLSLDEAFEKSVQFHEEIKKGGGIIKDASGNKIMEFPDGYYWVDLETNNCREEGEAMGHCASTSSDTLLSLRDRNNQPHVTVAFDYNGKINQIKGKGNYKPVNKYHPYIIEYLKLPNNTISFIFDDIDIRDYIVTGFGREYQPENDFHLSDLEREDIIDIINSNKYLRKSEDLVILYFLWEEDIITSEELADTWSDLIYDDENKRFILEFDEESVGTLFKDDLSVDIISNYYYNQEYYFYERLEFNYYYDWDRLDLSVKQKIVEKINNSNETFNIGQTALEINNKIFLDEKINDFKVKVEKNKDYLLKDILTDSNNEITNLINEATTRTYESTVIIEIYEKIKKSFKPIGEHIEFEKIDITDFLYQLAYKENFDTSDYNKIIYLISDMLEYSENIEKLEITVPKYGWTGKFDEKIFKTNLEDIIDEY